MDNIDPDSQLKFSINLIDFDAETVTPDAAEEEEVPLHLPDDPWDICMHEYESDSSSVILMPSSPIGETESPSVFPVQQLPIDVLISIFLAAVDTKRHDDTLTMSRTHPAVVASHVCREWREIALSSAALWSHIHLILPPYPFCLFEIMCSRARSFTGMNQEQAEDFWKKGLERVQKMTEIWLIRSGNCPLSVNVGEVEESHLVGEEGWPEDKMADGLVHLNKIIDLLCDALPRWRDFTFSCTITPHTRRLLSTPAQRCRLLRSAQVELRICSWGGWEGKLMSSATLLMAESLRSLEIPVLLQDIASIPVNWSNLTNLTFGGYWGVDILSGVFSISAPFGGHQALELLSKCPNLTSVDLQVVDGQTDWCLEPVTLQFLEEIVLQPSTSPFSLPVGFAPSLILPSLRKYTMTDGYGENIPSVHNGLVECIHQYAATLTDVTFCYLPLTQSALYDCLKQLQNIVRLNLLGLRYKVDGARGPEQASLSRELLVKMTPEFGESGEYIVDSCFCPRLQEFGCCPNQGTLDEVAFVDFIAGRRRIGMSSFQCSRLQKAFVDCRGFAFVDPYKFEIDIFQELARRGVDMGDFSLNFIN